MKHTVLSLLFILLAALCIVLAAADEAPGYISVTTSPTGGQVYIDHKYVMDAPGAAEVQPCSHLVSIQSSEYFTWSNEVFVRSGETTKVDAVMHFYKGQGSIGITSSMLEVDVYIDDMYYASVKSGTVAFLNLSSVEHGVRVVKAGYHDFTTTVQVPIRQDCGCVTRIRQRTNGRLVSASIPSPPVRWCFWMTTM